MRAFLVVVESLVIRESAVSWSCSATSAVIMVTQHSMSFRSHILGEFEVAACHLSFERAQLLRRAMR